MAAAVTEVINTEVFADVGPSKVQLAELFDALTELRRAAGDFEATPQRATT